MFGYHFVGFLTRRLIYLMVKNSFSNKTTYIIQRMFSLHLSTGKKSFIKQKTKHIHYSAHVFITVIYRVKNSFSNKTTCIQLSTGKNSFSNKTTCIQHVFISYLPVKILFLTKPHAFSMFLLVVYR